VTESVASVTGNVSASVDLSAADTVDSVGAVGASDKVVGPAAKRARRATTTATNAGQRDMKPDDVLSVDTTQAHSTCVHLALRKKITFILSHFT